MNSFDTLFRQGAAISYKKGEIIFSPSKKPKGIYFIKSGFIYSYSLSETHRKRIQNIVKAGDVFPLLWVAGSAPKHFYVEALTDVTLLVLENDFFLSQVFKHKQLMKEVISLLSAYLNVYVERVENLEMETVEKKILTRILHFAVRFGREEEEKIVITLPLTHSFIAQSINIARENVTREFGKLEKSAIITFKKSELVILNKEALVKKLNE